MKKPLSDRRSDDVMLTSGYEICYPYKSKYIVPFDVLIRVNKSKSNKLNNA